MTFLGKARLFRHRLQLAKRALFPGLVRHYGDDGTIHRTGEVNIEQDERGEIVSVWFRCSVVPFTAHKVGKNRADEMRRMYKTHPPMRITAIDYVEHDKSGVPNP